MNFNFERIEGVGREKTWLTIWHLEFSMNITSCKWNQMIGVDMMECVLVRT